MSDNCSCGDACTPASRRAFRIDDREAEAPTWWERYGRLTTTSVSGVALGIGLLLRFTGVQPPAVRLLLLTAAVSGGWYVARRAFQAILHGQLEMNTLMGIAAVGAVFIGEWAEAGSAMFLFSLAQLLEARSMDRARNAIRRLLDLSPKEATVRKEEGDIRLPVDRIAVGDVVVLSPGERVPVDGIVKEGTSFVNQAPITGESVPVSKALGSPVLAGSLNGQGTLEVLATRPASDSSLARIIHLVENAQAQRARSQTFIDRFARYYTPAMIAFAIALAVVPPLMFGQSFSSWLYRGLVVLVIACPCALVISTPVSFVCGLTRAAREGILFKGGVYLEELGRIRTFFFDKTGTLTLGKPEVVAVQPFRGRSEQEILRLAAAIEPRSGHPLAEAILDAAGSRGIRPPAATDVQAVPGMGVRGRVNGEICLVGNPSFFNGTSGMAGPDLEAIREWEGRGATVVVVGTGREAYGMIAIRDSVRKEAADALGELRSLGATDLTMLTGDNPGTGKAVASMLPMDAVHAGLLPEQKIALVREAVEKGKKVAMVGDGINDAPALAQATVGVVMGAAGTDVALEAGDVVLMGDDLRKIPFAVRLGRRTLRIIRFNVAFALGTKAVFLVLATAGMVTLWMGVAADMGASLLVIGNSMRLLWRANGRSGFRAIMVLLLFQLPACIWGEAGQVAITGKTVYAGMAIEEVQVRVLRPDGDHWKESASVRSGYHGSFIVKTNPGTIRLEARGEIFKNNKKIPLAGQVTALEVPSDIRRMDRIVIELAPVPDKTLE